MSSLVDAIQPTVYPEYFGSPWHTRDKAVGKVTAKVKSGVSRVLPWPKMPDQKETDQKITAAYEAYNQAYAGHFRSVMAQKAPSVSLGHHSLYEPSDVDQSTVEVYEKYGISTLDLSKMTKEDVNNMDAFLAPEERRLPLYARVQLAKVRLIDMAADLKDKMSPRPLAYNMIPSKPDQKVNVVPKKTDAINPRTAMTVKSLPRPEPQVIHDNADQNGRGWLKQAASAIGGVAKKLRLW